jgi:hypothetical protein
LRLHAAGHPDGIVCLVIEPDSDRNSRAIPPRFERSREIELSTYSPGALALAAEPLERALNG